MANINTAYDNFVLENEVTDMYKSRLDLQNFCTVDESLTAEAGDIVKVNVYTATDGAQDVALGAGNTKSIVVSNTTKPYTVKTAQTRFEWLDEEARRDPMIPYVGAQKAGIDIFNHEMSDIYGEFLKTKQTATLSGTDYFSAYVDAQALLNIEAVDQGAPATFSILSPADLAKVRKALKDDLKYVQAFAATGYVGTVAGTNLYVKKDATPGKIVVATKEAVKLIIKSRVATEIISEGNRGASDANIRKNTLFARAVYIPALHNETKAALITIGG